MKEESPKQRMSWFNHLLLFAVVQIIFLISDGASFWSKINLNQLGERVVSKFDWFFNSFQFYESQHLNIATVGWIVVLLVDGVLSLFEKFIRKPGIQ